MGKYTDFSLVSYMKSTAAPVLLLSLILYAFVQFKIELHSSSIMELAVNGAIVFVITAFISMFLLFKKKERLKIFHLLFVKK